MSSGHVLVSVLVLGTSVLCTQDTNSTNTGESRSDRQISWPGGLVPLGPCLSDRGEFGRCTSFRSCYPYFKLPQLGTWETWVLGYYDTCTYLTNTGRQKFGVCCTNPVGQKPPAATPPEIEEATGEDGGGSIPPNWPPPIPTHPPDHTIPPLPTHPPSPGYPIEPTSTKKPVTTTKKPKPKPPKPPKPTKPPTPPPNWPPPIPTHPPTAQPWPPTAATKPPTVAPEVPAKPTQPPAAVGDASCGAKNGFQDQERIVGGQNADPNEWPWIAALFNSGRQFCGGSLIDNTHILTAAHCVAHMTSWDVARLTVRLGDHNIKTNSEVKHVEKRVKRVVRHRNFDMRTLYNDIAILTLDSPVTFTQTIRSVCLPTTGTQARFDGATATVIGWGSLRENGPQPAVLQEVNIPVWTNQECKLKYGNAAPGGIVEHFLCAGRATKDSCSGDSGGPLMVNTAGRWTQVGIVSWGIGCGKGQYPGVYTRVTHFMSWITKNLK
ncbi:proclotting enzyme-like [Macrosteles quadrilineatus]|uniref:proclotting enzyme-like n=1 Tax=Macrosteles quadrilineatus TaxID=74068 RepID=UPI0023E1BB34|nr:proclotting enzyme-like [Macrosteles quadrilineatus]